MRKLESIPQHIHVFACSAYFLYTERKDSAGAPNSSMHIRSGKPAIVRRICRIVRQSYGIVEKTEFGQNEVIFRDIPRKKWCLNRRLRKNRQSPESAVHGPKCSRTKVSWTKIALGGSLSSRCSHKTNSRISKVERKCIILVWSVFQKWYTT